MSRARKVSLLGCAGFFLVACVEPPAQKKGEPVQAMAMPVQTAALSDAATHQLNRDEPWYEHPAQARPANGQLTASTRVRLLQDAGSYAKVQTADGRVCFVATDALTALPPR